MDIKTISLVMFIVGLTIALTAGALLFLGILSSSVSAMIGIIGICIMSGIGMRATQNFDP